MISLGFWVLGKKTTDVKCLFITSHQGVHDIVRGEKNLSFTHFGFLAGSL